MHYFVSFDPINGASRKQIIEAYNSFAKYFENKLPQFKFLGLYARNALIGSRPHYTAIWEFSDYSDLDEWNKFFTKDKKGKKLAKDLSNITSHWEAKVMSKLI